MKLRNFHYISSILVIIFLLSFSPLAESTPIGSRSDLPADVTTITFDLAPGTEVTNEYSGLSFYGGAVYPDFKLWSTVSGSGRNSTGIQVSFDSTANISVVGFDFYSYYPSLTMVAYGWSNDNILGEVTVTAQEYGMVGFLGLSFNESIKGIKVHDHGHTFNIDNFSYGPSTSASGVPVPEAGTLMLLGSGLLGLGIIRKKMKQ